MQENKILLTDDGSHTLESGRFAVTYHSKHGAIQEAQTVFIDAALMPILVQKSKLDSDIFEINILEIGLGTGLNALMTFLEIAKTQAQKPNIQLNYTAFEAYPPDAATIEMLNFADLFEEKTMARTFFNAIHAANWQEKIEIAPNIFFTKQLDKFENIDIENSFDIVYFDAFAPNSQPELWAIPIFEKMHRALRENGVLTTYCAKGEVKRNLKAAGFRVENLPGPKGKREMTRAWK